MLIWSKIGPDTEVPVITAGKLFKSITYFVKVAPVPFKVSAKHFAQNYCFQESGWLFFPGSSPDYLTHGFPVKACRENFNAMSYDLEDPILLQI